jgi:hypothetical protein
MENLAYPPTKNPELHLIYTFNQLPAPNTEELQHCFDNNTPTQPPAHIDWKQKDAHRLIGKAAWAGHEIHIAGLPIPLPREMVDQTVMVSPWQGQIKAAMRQHQAHISLVYLRGSANPIEKMVALYTLACAFANEDLLGIINANAWTAHPPADFLSPHNIANYRHHIPYNLWFGYVRFFTDAPGYWLVTKGHHIFDVPDLAYRVQPDENPDAAIQVFINIFHYLLEQDVFVTAGDTFEISSTGEKFLFTEVTELEDMLMGPSGTLVLQKLSPYS